MNTFEITILRILVKRNDAIRISSIIDGFPDRYIDNVLVAISNLHYKHYVFFSNYDSEVYVSLNKDMRKEILEILDPLSHSSYISQRHTIENTDKNNKIDNESSYYHFVNHFRKKQNDIPIIFNKIKRMVTQRQQQQPLIKKSNISDRMVKTLSIMSMIFFGLNILTIAVPVENNNSISGDNFTVKTLNTDHKYHTNHFYKSYYHNYKDGDTSSPSSVAASTNDQIQRISYQQCKST